MNDKKNTLNLAAYVYKASYLIIEMHALISTYAFAADIHIKFNLDILLRIKFHRALW